MDPVIIGLKGQGSRDHWLEKPVITRSQVYAAGGQESIGLFSPGR